MDTRIRWIRFGSVAAAFALAFVWQVWAGVEPSGSQTGRASGAKVVIVAPEAGAVIDTEEVTVAWNLQGISPDAAQSVAVFRNGKVQKTFTGSQIAKEMSCIITMGRGEQVVEVVVTPAAGREIRESVTLQSEASGYRALLVEKTREYEKTHTRVTNDCATMAEIHGDESIPGPAKKAVFEQFLKDRPDDRECRPQVEQWLRYLKDRENMVLVPGGTYRMGCTQGDPLCEADESPPHYVTVSSFHMDAYEVTVAQFEACVHAKGCNENFVIVTDQPQCNYGRDDRMTHPMNCVNWYAAEQYCKWRGKRLPTEAEWERAARDANSDNIYAWGNAPATCDRAVMNEDWAGCFRDKTWPVGKKPKGKTLSGLYDMAGNVAEWCGDYYHSGFYRSSPGEDPQGPVAGLGRVLRGGGWTDPAGRLRASDRHFGSDTNSVLTDPTTGFRCAGD
ncbi:MAG: SUMF1/EgtB/PvdO family nonheme iron enzyme [Candidatus Lernaella stagnicola]|nr:SUMF1/EgtB/PvdO family nonheme iron enzyme [Candidatus Lernaella stagnicola]